MEHIERMKEKLYQIIREVFNDPELEITENTTAADVDRWDSFNHMSLIMAIEEEFSLSFTTKEIGKMAQVGNLLEMIENKL